VCRRKCAPPRGVRVGLRRVRDASEPRAIEVKLMPSSVGLDATGKPTPALQKKLQAVGLAGLDPAKLQRRVDGKAETLFADSATPAPALSEALQAALDETLAALPI